MNRKIILILLFLGISGIVYAGLEDLTGASKFIDDLVTSNPVGGSDPKSEGDDHIRGIKNVLVNTFPNITGAVTANETELNLIDGVTSTTAELNILDGVTSTAAELNILDGVTATAAELNYVDITTLGTGAASKALTASAGAAVDASALTWTNLGAVTTADINGGTIDGVTIGATSAPTVTNLGTVTTADINGGTIDGVTIGGASAGAGTFTTLSVSSTSSLTGVTTHGGNVISDTDSTDDLGTNAVRWANIYVDAITLTGNITGSPTISGTLTSTGGFTATAGITSGSDIVSDTDSTDDLGTTGVRFANAYIDDIILTNGATFGGNEKLSAYIEDTYNPALTCETSGSFGLDTSEDTFSYIKIGKLVHVQGRIHITSDSSCSGGLLLSLPVAMASTLAESADRHSVDITIINHGDGGIENAVVTFVPGTYTDKVYLEENNHNGLKIYIDETRVDANFYILANFFYQSES